MARIIDAEMRSGGFGHLNTPTTLHNPNIRGTLPAWQA